MSNFTFPWKCKSGPCAVLACDLVRKLNGVAKPSVTVKHSSINITNVSKKFSATWFSYSGIRKIEDKMSYSVQEKALILEQFMQNKSVTVTKRWLRRTMGRNPPSRNDVLRWQQQFGNSGNLAHRGDNGRPGRTAENIARLLLMFQETPMQVPGVLQLHLEYHALRYSEF